LCDKIMKDMEKKSIENAEINVNQEINVSNLSLTKIVKLADIVIYEKMTKIYINNVMKGEKNILYSQELLKNFLILLVQNFILDNIEIFIGYQLISPQQLLDIRKNHDDTCTTLSLDSLKIINNLGLPKFCTNVPLINKKILISRL